MKKIIWGIAIMTISFLLVMPTVSAGESTLDTIMKRGVIRVGMSTFVPWAMKDRQGRLVGFEIDVATRLAKDMGVEVEFIPTAWSGIIPALLTGKFDVIIGGMGITPERNMKVNFTIPYNYTGMSMVAHKKKAEGFSSLEDFNKEDVTIAVRMGATPEAAVKRYMPKAILKFFENESQALQELNLGRVHAVVASAPMPMFYALKYPDKLFVPLKENFTREPIAFALRKGDVDTLNFFDNWIRFNTEKGFFLEKAAYWFQSKDWEPLVR